MSFEKYGTKLDGYSLCNGNKLKRWFRESDKEYTLGYILSEEKEKHDPVKITIWTLTNGDKYHFVHSLTNDN